MLKTMLLDSHLKTMLFDSHVYLQIEKGCPPEVSLSHASLPTAKTLQSTPRAMAEISQCPQFRCENAVWTSSKRTCFIRCGCLFPTEAPWGRQTIQDPSPAHLLSALSPC